MNKKDELRQLQAEFDWQAVKLFHQLLDEKTEITADDFAAKAVEAKLNPLLVRKTSAKLFKSALTQGFVTKSPAYRLSSRHNSNVMPVYIVVKPKKQANGG